MKKVIALSIGLAFSVGSMAQEQAQATKMEKTQSIVKDIVTFAKTNTPTPVVATSTVATVAPVVAEVKPAEAPVKAETKVEVKTEAKVEPKAEVKVDAKPAVKAEVSKEDIKPAVAKAEPVKKEEAKVEAVKVEAAKPTVKEAVKETAKVETKEVKVAEAVKVEAVKSEASNPTPIKHVVKHKVKKVAKHGKAKSENKVVETPAVLLQADYFYIPKQATMDQYELFAKPITYNDVDLVVNRNEDKVSLSLMDKRINQPLDKAFLAKPTITILNMTTDLENKEVIEAKYEEGTSQVSFEQKDSCRAIFVEYQLNGQVAAKSVAKFIDKDGNLFNSLPESCKVNISESKDTTFYTANGNIINMNFSQKQNAEKGLNIQIHFTREGHEFTPNNLKAYAIAKDFSGFYTFNTKVNTKGAYFGIDVSQKVAPGAYYVVIGHDQGNKVEWVKSNVSVQ